MTEKYVSKLHSRRLVVACRVCLKRIDNAIDGFWVYRDYRICEQCKQAGVIDMFKLGNVTIVPFGGEGHDRDKTIAIRGSTIQLR